MVSLDSLLDSLDSTQFHRLGEGGLSVRWRLGDGATLRLLVNLGAELIPISHREWPAGEGSCTRPTLIVQPPPGLDCRPGRSSGSSIPTTTGMLHDRPHAARP